MVVVLGKSVIPLKASTVTAKSGSVWFTRYVVMKYMCALRIDVESLAWKATTERKRSPTTDWKRPW